uniref:Uncharacterized protein n=1 Tax=Candidatus Kentrum eta TaxID=2126337 RepID=A0A450UKF8_9GAMM|nr:MAG: hypothetical protein BECKH772A_GA0070896_100516 [Candidatus Kentron sp. H]VFJ93731.1 MAG: hypothetical protein BECKH772B_GA0070898_100496 [Candidatus Kentron sp. H]VFK00551.1 MAG: hypothetical protein BECKH772C_GA0070978_100486 [Candidatus Kentron sp. H]
MPKKLFGNSQSTAAAPELRPAALRRGRKLRHVVHYNPYFLPHRALREPQSGRHLATIRISKQLLRAAGMPAKETSVAVWRAGVYLPDPTEFVVLFKVPSLKEI